MNITEPKSERIATRVSVRQKTLISRAASIRGRSLTQFMLESAEKEAVNTIEEAQLIQLSVEHQHHLAQILLNPPRANKALKQAAQTYDNTPITSR